MKKRYIFIVGIILVMLSSFVLNSITGKKCEKVELTISAAASLQEVLYEIKELYEKENSNIKLNFNFGSSGTLQKQIEQGAPVDLFISASEKHFAPILENGVINENDYVKLLKNELVFIVPKGGRNINSFEQLTNVQSISIGTPETVPAGRYAVEFLENIEIWNKVEEKLIYAKDVRQVLTYVETGNVEVGVVYKTDALSSKDIQIADIVDDKLHAPIVYPLGIVKDSKHYEEAKEFSSFLQSKEILKVFETYGFTTN